MRNILSKTVLALPTDNAEAPGKHRGKKYQMRTLGLLLAAVLASPGWASADTAVTLPPLAGLVNLLDAEAKPFCLLPTGADPHHFQISPRTAERLKSAGLLIRSPAADGGWPLPNDPDKTLRLWPKTNHAWLVPDNVAAALPDIAAALSRMAPARAETIRRQLPVALAATERVKAAWSPLLAGLKSHGVIMQHPSWQPLMEAAGVPVLAVLESEQHGHEEGPHALQEALDILKQHPDAWLIGDSRHSNRTLEWLARHADGKARLVYLDALGECGTGWEQLMLDNLGKLQP